MLSSEDSLVILTWPEASLKVSLTVMTTIVSAKTSTPTLKLKILLMLPTVTTRDGPRWQSLVLPSPASSLVTVLSSNTATKFGKSNQYLFLNQVAIQQKEFAALRICLQQSERTSITNFCTYLTINCCINTFAYITYNHYII